MDSEHFWDKDFETPRSGAVTQVQDYPDIVRHRPIISGCSFLVLLLQLLT